MKRILFVTAALTMIAGPALAQPTTSALNGSVTVNGSVAARCEFQGAQGLNGPHNVTIPEAVFLDTTNGQLNSALESAIGGTLSGVTMWCNGAGTDVALSATPFGNMSASVTSSNANFADRVDFALSVGLTGLGAMSIDTASVAKGVADTAGYNNVGPFYGEPTIGFDIADSNKILVAGNYSSTVALTVTPGI